MADERDKEQFDSESKSDRQITGQQGQQGQQSEFGQRGKETPAGSEPPSSMGTKGGEFGQSDLGSQSDTTLAGSRDQQDLKTDRQGRTGGAGESTGEGFVGSQGSGSDEYLRERGSSEKAAGGSDFAKEGRGASEDDEGSTGGSDDAA